MVASKFGYKSTRGDPYIWIGLDHLRFGMDRGMDRPMNFRVWIGLSIVTRYIQLTLPAAFNDVLRQ